MLSSCAGGRDLSCDAWSLQDYWHIGQGQHPLTGVKSAEFVSVQETNKQPKRQEKANGDSVPLLERFPLPVSSGECGLFKKVETKKADMESLHDDPGEERGC